MVSLIVVQMLSVSADVFVSVCLCYVVCRWWTSHWSLFVRVTCSFVLLYVSLRMSVCSSVQHCYCSVC